MLVIKPPCTALRPSLGSSRKVPAGIVLDVRSWPIVLQNDFERWSEEHFSEIARKCGILIQESAPSDSNLAPYWPIGS